MPVVLMTKALLDPTSKVLEMEALPKNTSWVVPALIENILDILAVTPDELAISKYASGEVSPSPNLPNEAEEKMANMESLVRS